MDDHFDHVLAECRPIADNKMPVSRKLLVELLSVSEQTFQVYNTALFQAMILTAWGACMRISEYSFTRAHLPNHNVRRGAVLPGKKGLSVEFYLDKVTKLHAAVKHRFISWSFLPGGAKAMLNRYIVLRPKAAKYFFVQMDGRPLRQKNVIDMLDACVLQTKFRFLQILPHGLRSGGASQKRLDGSHILDIRHDCRWSETGRTIDHYSRPNLIDLGPKKVFEE